MNKFIRKSIFSAIALATAFSNVQAQTTEFTIYGSTIPEYVVSMGPTADQSSGLMIEIAAAALKKAGIPVKMAPEMPWPRAQESGKDQAGSILLHLARTPAREPIWRWVSIPYSDKVYGLTMKGQPTYSSYEDIAAKKANAGVKLASASESLLKTLGVTMSAVPNMDQNIMKLLTDRINVVLMQGMEITPAIKSVQAQNNPEMSARIRDIRLTAVLDVPLWIVTSKLTPEGDVKRLQDAIENFKKTPEYLAIVKKYEGKLPAAEK